MEKEEEEEEEVEEEKMEEGEEEGRKKMENKKAIFFMRRGLKDHVQLNQGKKTAHSPLHVNSPSKDTRKILQLTHYYNYLSMER